ncbi:hypothetical protein GPALN_005104 [Globodera pallida]|nr:hypothetical protein GPALN_005104 [Globodera pallida]
MSSRRGGHKATKFQIASSQVSQTSSKPPTKPPNLLQDFHNGHSSESSSDTSGESSNGAPPEPPTKPPNLLQDFHNGHSSESSSDTSGESSNGVPPEDLFFGSEQLAGRRRKKGAPDCIAPINQRRSDHIAGIQSRTSMTATSSSRSRKGEPISPRCQAVQVRSQQAGVPPPERLDREPRLLPQTTIAGFWACPVISSEIDFVSD